MAFDSFGFFIFLPLVFFLYWSVLKKSVKLQNGLLLVASYFFYGLWDWRFLFLILASTIVDYLVGIAIHKNKDHKKKQKTWLWASVLFNISLLGFFKYYNFFTDSFLDMFQLFGYSIKSSWTLNIILPVGISFYTFQTMSYSLDIYYKRIAPTKNFLSFATFVAFFPQLVAGPIERASNLLGQITQKKVFSYNRTVEGLKLILWGLFKKMVIADSLAPIVDDIFANYEMHSAPTLIMGLVFFSFQIYGDFSGYSDIAIGTSKLLGVELMSNFKFPYLSRNIGEFWRRWHISLSTWFRDYIYIPLGGSKVKKKLAIRNVFVVFLISGFWHGANWTFVVWGLFHSFLFLPSFLTNTNRKYLAALDISGFSFFLRDFFKITKTFILVTIGWVFFRSPTLGDALKYLNRMVFDFGAEEYLHPKGYRIIDYVLLIGIFVIYEYVIRKDERNPFKFKNRFLRFFVYTTVVLFILMFYDDDIDRSFIYFQF